MDRRVMTSTDSCTQARPARPRPPALAVAALLIAALPTAGAAVDAGASESFATAEAPVIQAPDDPGRTPPGLDANAFESGVFNSFTTGDVLSAPAPAASLAGAASAPVVVEMFTSQGCSSCPPADAMLSMLAAQPDVLALSYHVDYWDYLGWADSFARPEFTARQEGYARAAKERAIYTPQIIVAGHDTVLAPGPAQLNALIDTARFAAARVSVQRDSLPSGEAIELLPLSDLGGKVEIVMVRYAPQREVDVTSGENRGRRVAYSNVVLAVEPLALWDGKAPLRLTVRAELDETGRFPDDTRHALLVQRLLPPADLPGPILAALRLD